MSVTVNRVLLCVTKDQGKSFPGVPREELHIEITLALIPLSSSQKKRSESVPMDLSSSLSGLLAAFSNAEDVDRLERGGDDPGKT